MKYLLSVWFIAATTAAQNPVIRSGTNAAVDLSGAIATQPARKGAGAPSGTCIQGEQYFRTDATPGQNLYFCTSTNSWVQMTGGGGGGGNLIGATDPGTCTPGQLFFNTTVGVQQVCSSANLWTPLRESVSGAGISLVHTGTSSVIATDTAVMLTRAANQAGTDRLVALTSSSTDNYTGGLTPTLTAYADGMLVVFRPNFTNIGAATLNIDSLGPVFLRMSDCTSDPVDATFTSGTTYLLTYKSSASAFCLVHQPDITLTTFFGGNCQGATASVVLATPSTNAPTARCINSGTTIFGVADFDAATDQSVQGHFPLPADWDSGIPVIVDIRWLAPSATGDVVWGIQGICAAVGESAVSPVFSSAQTVTDSAQTPANSVNNASITLSTSNVMAGCAPSEEFFFRFFRDADNGSDSMAGAASLVWLSFKYKRNQ